jgi:hypothetical protein
MDSDDLPYLLGELGPELTKLNIRRTAGQSSTGEWFHNLHLGSLLEDLNDRQHSLKELSFTSPEESLFAPTHRRLDISTLHDFHALKILKTDAVFFRVKRRDEP